MPIRIKGRVEAGAKEVVHWTITGERGARRLVDWHELETQEKSGTRVTHPKHAPYDPAQARLAAGQAQLDGLYAMFDGSAHPLATLREELEVQEMTGAILKN